MGRERCKAKLFAVPQSFLLIYAIDYGWNCGVGGIKGWRRNIYKIGCADETILIADSEEMLQRLMVGSGDERRNYELSLNKWKTEILGLKKRREQLFANVSLEGRKLDQVRSFKYLGSLVSDDRKCDSEITSRIAMGRRRLDR